MSKISKLPQGVENLSEEDLRILRTEVKRSSNAYDKLLEIIK
jgi:hypothetical protein